MNLVIERLDSAMERINHRPMDKLYEKLPSYRVDDDLSNTSYSKMAAHRLFFCLYVN